MNREDILRALFFYRLCNLFFYLRFTAKHYGLPKFMVGTYESPGAVVWLCGFCFHGKPFHGWIIKEQWDGSLNRMDRWKTCSLWGSK